MYTEVASPPTLLIVAREARLNELDELLDELSYPVDRTRASEAMSDVTLQLADGERNLGALILETDSEMFDSGDDIVSELHNTLPREAVGEPFQSEGEG